MNRRKGGRSQDETRRGPRVFQPPRLWTRSHDKLRKEAYAIGKIAKLKMVEIEPGVWHVIHIFFIVNEQDEYLERDELVDAVLKVVEET